LRVLLDEDLPHQLRLLLVGHHVFTVRHLGWNGLKNGELLSTADAAGYDVFVTGDKNLSYQQNIEARRIAVVVLSAQKIDQIKPYITKIVEAIDEAKEGSFRFVKLDED
jgi:predicted nuclease of predicted toxin-antitoxin system